MYISFDIHKIIQKSLFENYSDFPPREQRKCAATETIPIMRSSTRRTGAKWLLTQADLKLSVKKKMGTSPQRTNNCIHLTAWVHFKENSEPEIRMRSGWHLTSTLDSPAYWLLSHTQTSYLPSVSICWSLLLGWNDFLDITRS